MLSLFATPWALLALLAVPALVAIYWLRNRFRQVPVSSLMLWMQQRESREGGLRVRRLQTPLLFFLELLAILLLVLGAAGPLASKADDTRPLVVVLDDSFSMRAGGVDSPRTQARAAIAEELGRGHDLMVRFILAGDRPQVLGTPVLTTGEALALLDGWQCRAPAANLEEAIGLAAEVAGPRGRILVVSDHQPTDVPGQGRVQWRAYGTARPNVAFVTAARTLRDGKERCLLEIANVSNAPRTTALVVEAGSRPAVLHRATLQLAPMEVRRVGLQLPAGTPALTARIEPDALEIDNRVTLLPDVRRPVRVAVRLKDEALQALVEKALRATQRAILTRVAPELVFTSGDEEQPGGESWQVQILVDKEAEAYVGPFVVERTHPLTQGLHLEGVVWGAGKTRLAAGVPVLLAGNIPLLTDTEGAGGRHTLRLRFRPDLSTLQDSPAWPILFWNLLQWRAAEHVVLQRVNLRLGESAVLTMPASVEVVRVTSPDGEVRQVPVHDHRAVIRADDVGRYEIQVEDRQYAFAVNALNREESDLTHCASGRWGEWVELSAGVAVVQSVSWILLLLAALVLTAHLTLVGAKPTFAASGGGKP